LAHNRHMAGGETWQQRGGTLIALVLGLVGIPLAVIFGLPLLYQDIGPAWDAANGRGVHGTMIVHERDCRGRGPCNPRGSFESDDGSLRIDRVHMSFAPPGWSVGSQLRAIYSGGRPPPTVFSEGFSLDWALITALGVGIIILGGLWLGIVTQVVAIWWRRWHGEGTTRAGST
jgi:hypothetical protein